MKTPTIWSGNPDSYNLPVSSIDNELEDTPEGYYAFVESPKMEPPQVKLPPYIRLNRPCTSEYIQLIYFFFLFATLNNIGIKLYSACDKNNGVRHVG